MIPWWHGWSQLKLANRVPNHKNSQSHLWMLALAGNGLLLAISYHKYAKAICESLFDEKGCLRQPPRLHWTLFRYMSWNPRNVIFCRKKGACGSREDLNRANTYQKIPRTPFLLTKNACSSREDFNRANTCHKISGTSFLPNRKAPAAAWKTSPSYHSQRAPAIFVIGSLSSQFELWFGMPSRNHNLASQPAICHEVIHGL